MPWTSTMHQPALRILYTLSHESSQYTHGPEYCKLHPIKNSKQFYCIVLYPIDFNYLSFHSSIVLPWKESPGFYSRSSSFQLQDILLTTLLLLLLLSLSHAWLFATPWTIAHQASLAFTVSQSLLTLRSIELMMPSNHLIICHPLSSCLQSFPASESFPVSQLFASGGQSIGASVSTSVLPMNIQGWFPLGWTGWISLQSKGLSRVFSSTTIRKHQFFSAQPSLWSNCHITTGKTIALTTRTLVGKWCLCFLILCLGLPKLFFQGARIFSFHGCSHHLQWFWSPRK